MQKLFNKILVPINFSLKSKTLLIKAVDFAKEYNCSIHLLYAATLSPFAAMAAAESRTPIIPEMIDNKKEQDFKFEKLCKDVMGISNHNINIQYSIVYGTWNEAIIDFVNQNKFDLVLIGQKPWIEGKRKMILNPDKIADKASVPVFTIPSNRSLTRLNTILIPITDFLPVRKLMYGIYIATGKNATLKLLAVENKKTKEKVHNYLERSFQLIRDNSDVAVEMDTIESDNIANAVNEFARLHAADLIILNPGAQSKMPGFFSSLLGNIIQKYSAPPVLAVNPV